MLYRFFSIHLNIPLSPQMFQCRICVFKDNNFIRYQENFKMVIKIINASVSIDLKCLTLLLNSKYLLQFNSSYNWKNASKTKFMRRKSIYWDQIHTLCNVNLSLICVKLFVTKNLHFGILSFFLNACVFVYASVHCVC